MGADKILQRIHVQIDELTPTLELFADDNIQPSVQDCETLQKQLALLQENLAVYKYNKQNKELSPSFNIHAKISEKESETGNKTEIAKEIKEIVNLEKQEKAEVRQSVPEIQNTEIPKIERMETATRPKHPLAIGINDKFRFINELFSQNSSEYNIALEQLNNVTSWNEAEIYLNSLKSIYEWQDKDEVVLYFFSVVKKRFE